MKANAVKAARIRIGYSQKEAVQMLNMKTQYYTSRENGYCKFTDQDKIAVARLFNLSFTEMNYILFDGILPMDILTEKDIKEAIKTA